MENEFTVEFYENEKGEKPCLEFLNSLDVKLRAKVFHDLDLLEQSEIEKAKAYRKDYQEKNQ